MERKIWLDIPGSSWKTGLPLGNGRLAAMIGGKQNPEIITLNEETIWYGGDFKRTNPDTKDWIPQIRQYLMDGEVEKAQYYGRMAITSCPQYEATYHPAGNLRIVFFNHAGEMENYRRELDLDTAQVTVSYDLDGAHYVRDAIACHQPNVLAFRFTTDSPEGITLNANLERRPLDDHAGKLDDKTVAIWGQCGEKGVRYFGGLRMSVKDGSQRTIGNFVSAEQCREVTLYVCFATDFRGREDFKEYCLKQLAEAEAKGYELLREEQKQWYSGLYNRMDLRLEQGELPNLPTDKLVEKLKEEDDSLPLTELLFHFGRYLTIASSTDCQLPSNLQGIWNGDLAPMCDSKYTINLNTEMNYWPTEICNLPECHLPLFDHMERMLVKGRKTAKEIYGCRGFVAHHNTDLWAETDPDGILDSSPVWPMGAAWLCLHFYEHYRFTLDEEFLINRALPIMGEAILFFSDYLMPDEKGRLLSGPSLSPENTYCTKMGEKAAICMAPTMDNQIIRQLCRDYLEGAEIARLENEITQAAKVILEKLPKTEISSDGRIMEWLDEYLETAPGHRHTSHLFGLYPGMEISEKTPDLLKAARKTLEYRIAHRIDNWDGLIGWIKTWNASFFARLKDSKAAHFNLMELLRENALGNLLDSQNFQIDGNFSATSAIAEMLLQSHQQKLELLPALPEQWKKGTVRGMRGRGGYTISFSWEQGEKVVAEITSDRDSQILVVFQGTEKFADLKARIPQTFIFSC